MSETFKENNVFEEALDRIRMLYDTHDDIIVSMSGGKDSTVLFNITLMVAKEKGRLPVKVFWLDQEAEWKATVDYMDKIMRREDVKPYWFQIPFDFTNTLSPQENFLAVWDESQKDKWVHPKSDISIKENPSKCTRFHDLVNVLPEYCTDSDNCAVLVGMRVTESLNRRAAIRLGMTEIPCIVSHADPEAIKADRIADNKISEFSEWINEELMHEIDMIDFDFDFTELGFPSVSFDDIPSMDDFAEQISSDEERPISDEEKQKLYQEFLEKQAKENAVEVQIATENDLKKAEKQQIEVPKKPVKYYKCVCEKCGHVMFVDASTLWNPESGLETK